MADIIDVEGIGPTFADKLKQAGIETTEALLQKGAKPKVRQVPSLDQVKTWIAEAKTMPRQITC